MSTPRWRDEIPNSHLFHPCLLYTSTSWGNRALSDAETAISPIIFFNSRFQWQVYIVVEQMNWFIGWEIVYTMVGIWGALSSCRSQFHLLASWWSLHTPARRPWNCNCFNKRRTPLGERVYDWLRIPTGEWLYSVHSYLIFAIFFTRAKFLENKIYTEKRQFFAFNL